MQTAKPADPKVLRLALHLPTNTIVIVGNRAAVHTQAYSVHRGKPGEPWFHYVTLRGAHGLAPHSELFLLAAVDLDALRRGTLTETTDANVLAGL